MFGSGCVHRTQVDALLGRLRAERPPPDPGLALEGSSVAASEDKAALCARSVQVTAAALAHVFLEGHLRPTGFRSHFPNYQLKLQAAILI